VIDIIQIEAFNQRAVRRLTPVVHFAQKATGWSKWTLSLIAFGAFFAVSGCFDPKLILLAIVMFGAMDIQELRFIWRCARTARADAVDQIEHYHLRRAAGVNVVLVVVTWGMIIPALPVLYYASALVLASPMVAWPMRWLGWIIAICPSIPEGERFFATSDAAVSA
jgi:hypothetical protein